MLVGQLSNNGSWASNVVETAISATATPLQVWCACHTLAEGLRGNAAALRTATQRFPQLLKSLISGSGGAVSEAPKRLARLRVLCAICECDADGVSCAEETKELIANVPQFVETLLNVASDIHVAVAAAMLLYRLAPRDAQTKNVILKRIGADKFLSAFRSAWRSREVENPTVASTNGLVIYSALWLASLRDSFERCKAEFQQQLSGTAVKGTGVGGGARDGIASVAAVEAKEKESVTAELARARAAVAAAELECAKLREELAAQRALTAEQPKVVAGVEPGNLSFEALLTRDKEISALKHRVTALQEELEKKMSENATLKMENDKLLMMVADLELARLESK